jgi:hypothetical protein
VAFGTLDLSIATDHLVQTLRDCIGASDLWGLEPPGEGLPPNDNPAETFVINVTGNAPDITEADAEGCALTVYLFHVENNAFMRNSPVIGDPAVPLPIPYQPMALNLYYLLSAYARGNYVQEQQAMSIALKCLYEHTLLRDVMLAKDGRPTGYFTLTMETQSSGEIAALWQSFAVPNRLCAIYRMSVVFLQPQIDERPPAPKPQTVSIDVGVSDAPYSVPQLTTTVSHIRYIGPNDVPADPTRRDFHTYDLAPASVAPGQRMSLYGTGLSAGLKIVLVRPGLADLDITAWLDAAALQTENALVLLVPDPAGLDPGVYLIRCVVGPTSTAVTPFCLAPRVDAPPSPPVVASGGPPVVITGAGFLSGKTQLFLESTLLSEAAVVAAGNFSINGTGTQISFLPPAGLPSGRFGVRVRVNDIEASPAVWVQLP